MQVNAKHCATSFDWLDTSTSQYFGPISDALAAVWQVLGAQDKSDRD